MADPREPEQCPTCGSDDPAKRLYRGWFVGHPCPDPWHSSGGTERCTCRLQGHPGHGKTAICPVHGGSTRERWSKDVRIIDGDWYVRVTVASSYLTSEKQRRKRAEEARDHFEAASKIGGSLYGKAHARAEAAEQRIARVREAVENKCACAARFHTLSLLTPDPQETE